MILTSDDKIFYTDFLKNIAVIISTTLISIKLMMVQGAIDPWMKLNIDFPQGLPSRLLMQGFDVIMVLRQVSLVPLLVQIGQIAEFPALKGWLLLFCEFVEVTIKFDGFLVVLPRCYVL